MAEGRTLDTSFNWRCGSVRSSCISAICFSAGPSKRLRSSAISSASCGASGRGAAVASSSTSGCERGSIIVSGGLAHFATPARRPTYGRIARSLLVNAQPRYSLPGILNSLLSLKATSVKSEAKDARSVLALPSSATSLSRSAASSSCFRRISSLRFLDWSSSC